VPDRDFPDERPASPTVKKQHLASNSSETPSTMESAPKAHLNGHVNGRVPENHANAGPRTLAKLQTDQKTPSEPASLITSPTLAGPQPDDPIEALDYLEDAIEEVGKILPNLETVAPEKPAKKENVAKPGPKPTTSGKTRSAAAKVAPRTGPSLVKTTQPSAAATRSRAMPATSSTPKPTTSTASKRHSTIAPAKSAKDAATPTTKTAKPPVTDYLASRRRPISLQIPPPPERIRSAKPPTRPTFTLPGDSLTAKSKAATEERKRKEEEALARRREFKARPVPGAVSRARPASMIVRQTTSSRARMSVCGVEGAEALAALGASAASSTKAARAAPAGLRRAGTVTGATTVTSESKAKAKAAADRAAARAKRASVVAPAAAAPQKRTAGVASPPRASIVVRKRSPAAGPAAASPRPTAASPRAAAGPSAGRSASVAVSVASSAGGSAVTAEDAAAQRHKARAIFNRDRAEGEARERSRREKEEAARRARAEAAEKGRVASREWAEKQKRRAASAAAAAKAAQVTVPAVE
jgi:hypothetical protein